MSSLEALKAKAKNWSQRITYGGEIDKKDFIEFMGEIRRFVDDMALAESTKLAKIVYDAVYEAVESFEEENIGADLAYVLGAIVKNNLVEWEREDLPPLYEVLKSMFTVEHPVWQHIAIKEPEDGD